MASIGDVRGWIADPARVAAVRATGLSDEPDSALERFARMVRFALHVPIALVTLMDDTRQFYPGAAGLDPGGERSVPIELSFCQHMIATDEPLVVPDARTHPLLGSNPATEALGVVAYAGVPLADPGGFVVGSVCAIDQSPRDWTPEELVVLSDLAASCMSELQLRASVRELELARAQTASVLAQAEATAARLALIAEVSRALSSSLDSIQTVDRLLESLVPAACDWAVVTRVEASGELGLAAGRHRKPELTPVLEELTRLQPHLTTETALVRRVALSGEPILLSDAGSDRLADATVGGEIPRLVERLGLASAMVVPLQGRADLTGVLTMANQPGSRIFDADDLAVAGDIGRRAALALENARLFGRQSRAAEVLQRSLLTRLPEPDHLHLVARYRPAAREAQVGGDWYDAFLQPDGATVLVIGDVVGHDIAAAATMSQIRTMLRGFAYDRGAAPAEVLSRVDKAMTGLQVDTLATVVVARLEQTEADRARGIRRLRWSNAGHPPPLFVLPDGSVRALDSSPDLLLGVDHDTERHDHEVELVNGSTLLLYTDGLVETRTADLDAGVARLCEVVAQRAALQLDDFADAVLSDLLTERPDDDIAVITTRLYAEDGPRPVAAGPRHTPASRPSVD